MEAQNMQDKVDNHEMRITKLENDYQNVMSKIGTVEQTVRDEGREQRNLLNILIKHFLGMDKQKDNNKTKIILAVIAALGGTGGVVSIVLQITK